MWPGISYPQFVEVLSLLATAAASRLRSLYPDVAGVEPCIRIQGSSGVEQSAIDGATGSGVDLSGSRSGPSAFDKDSPARVPGVVGVDKAKDGANLGGVVRKRAINVRAVLRMGARCVRSMFLCRMGARG